MIPKTVVQKRAIVLSKKLPLLNSRQINWGKNLFDKFKYERKYDVSCFECGVRFPKSKRITCPNCHAKLKPWTETKRSGQDYWYMSVFTTIKEFQVLRYFRINKYMRVDKPAEFFFTEVYQHWLSNTGKYVLISKLISPFSYYRFDPWSRMSEMEVRGYAGQLHLLDGIPMYPYRRILRELYRNGFYDDYYDFHPARLFALLLGSSIAETFFKAGKIDMLKIYARNEKEFTMFWPSYKICTRHKYEIDDWSTWFDHMKLLKYFKYDLRSPKYICSPTFIDDHNKLLKRKRVIENKIREERIRNDRIAFEAAEKIRIEKEKAIIKTKKKYFDLKISNGKIDVVVLSKIKDFKDEGRILQHCVYDSGYHKKAFSLILSARIKKKRLETIELDLKEMKIIQSRGLRNENSKYHDEIINLVNNNINLISNINTKTNQKQYMKQYENS